METGDRPLPAASAGYEWRLAHKLVSTSSASAVGRQLHRLIRRDRRRPLQVTVSYRSGPEAWWQLDARGVTLRLPGHTPLHEALDRFTGSL